MSTFVVVHGAWGSPSEMEPIVDPLTRAGHPSILVDLPCTAPDATLDDYARAVGAALPSDLSDVVLVGHSFGGFTISTIGARHPELTLVYVPALMPDEGSSLVSMILGEDAFVASDEATGIAAFGGPQPRCWAKACNGRWARCFTMIVCCMISIFYPKVAMNFPPLSTCNNRGSKNTCMMPF